MKIAVIDGGIIPAFKESYIVDDLVVNSDNLVVDNLKQNETTSDHGFNVCKIINMYTPEANIISIRIFDSMEARANIQALITALEYCLKNNIPLIHLSGGSTNLFDDYLLRDIIKRIIMNNQILVAAHSNEKGLSFPALYPGVFSARADELFKPFKYNRNRWGYDFLMPSNHRIRLNESLDYITKTANSYAAPVLTSNIYNIVTSKKGKEIILRELGMDKKIFLCELPFFLDDVTIINLNCRIIIEELLEFRVKGIYNDISFEMYGGDYIYIPYGNKNINIIIFKELLERLSKNKEVNRIFYLGKVGKDIESTMRDYPFEFWILADNDIYPISIIHTELKDVGTIYFRGNDIEVYSIMVGLRDRFLEKGYNCFAISDYMEAVLYGIYYFQDLENSIRRKQLEYVLEPDVELVYGQEGNYKETGNSMIIEVLRDKKKIKLIISERGRAKELNIYGVQDYEILFSIITD